MASRWGCWLKATWAGPSRSRATQATRPAWGPPTHSPRRPSCRFTTRIGPRSSCTTAVSTPGSDFQTLAIEIREQKLKTKGKGLRLLTGSVTSPTLTDQIQRLLKELPEAKWHGYEPVTSDAVRQGARLAFDEPLEPIYHLAKADVILALDADFLTWGPDAPAPSHATLPRGARARRLRTTRGLR